MTATIAKPQVLAERLAAFLAHVHRTSAHAWFAAVTELELSLSQLKALHTLLERDAITVKELAESLGLSVPATSRAADALAARGLVERREAEQDRRCRLLSLTPAGREAVERLQAARIAGLADFVGDLEPAQQRALAVALEELAP